MRFEIFKNVNNEYCWRLRASNGEIIAHGESYKEKQSCRAAIHLVRQTDNVPVKELD
jgi:uncharacterized protein YegP (UPF0339 family)